MITIQLTEILQTMDELVSEIVFSNQSSKAAGYEEYIKLSFLRDLVIDSLRERPVFLFPESLRAG